MHEVSIAQAVLSRVAREAEARGARGVRSVDLVLGELSGVDAELLARAFAASELEVRIQEVAASWRCAACDASAAGPRCARCGGPARLATGGELLIERIELEVP
ncbi:MAG: hydrogenase maturation nickel metallochaperone HypA [Myxococcales bacterium]|nr:hydrogenase maturation nickel metallochaperone HypA [Myxococcales bacterium]MCB9580958.1 hydrogenase maturation nickel metallochaperone HypA [Polyangiaceae bacterium]